MRDQTFEEVSTSLSGLHDSVKTYKLESIKSDIAKGVSSVTQNIQVRFEGVKETIGT